MGDGALAGSKLVAAVEPVVASGCRESDAPTVQDPAKLLDEQLNSLYGSNFSAVVEREFTVVMSKGLYEGLAADPGRAVIVLRRMFGAAAVGVIFSDVVERLQDSRDPRIASVVAVLESAARRELP